MTEGHWIPLDEWEAEIPQKCSVCGEVLTGRELGYLPMFCDGTPGREDCPGATDRLRTQVRPATSEEEAA